MLEVASKLEFTQRSLRQRLVLKNVFNLLDGYKVAALEVPGRAANRKR